MLYLGREDAQMMSHVDEVIRDRMLGDDTYEPDAVATVDKLGKLATPALVIDGAEQTREEAAFLFQDIVKAELHNWVPGASQRLLFRAGAALGFQQPHPELAQVLDCGPATGDHAVFSDWVAGLFVLRCSSCFRIFPN